MRYAVHETRLSIRTWFFTRICSFFWQPTKELLILVIYLRLRICKIWENLENNYIIDTILNRSDHFIFNKHVTVTTWQTKQNVST